MGKKIYFITGTDTDVGKTIVTCGLLEAARMQGLATVGLKPVSAGCAVTEDGLRNDDALALMNAMTCQLAYEQVNPIAYELPIAPHISMLKNGKHVTAEQLAGYCRGAFIKSADLALIEGVGGWRVPLNSHQMLSLLAGILSLPVILVVGIKLGCLNHACLTAESIIRDGREIAGWVANCIDGEMQYYEENISTLNSLIRAPCLGVVPYLQKNNKESIASYLNVSYLLK